LTRTNVPERHTCDVLKRGAAAISELERQKNFNKLWSVGVLRKGNREGGRNC